MKLTLPQVIGHRGAAAYAPENTLLGLEHAAKLGASWVECDIRLTRDQQLYVFHDASLRRITGRAGRFQSRRSNQLELLNAAARYPGNVPKQAIPSLQQWLLKAQMLELGVNVELKSSALSAKPMLQALQQLLQSLPQLSIPLLFSSSHYKTLQLLQQQLPQWPRAMVITRWRGNLLKRLAHTQCVSAHIDYRLLNLERISALKQQHLQIIAYTVNEQSVAHQLLEQGVDGIFSDYPDLCSKQAY